MKQINNQVGARLIETQEAKDLITLFQQEKVTFDEAKDAIRKLQDKVTTINDITEAIRNEVIEYLEDTLGYISHHSEEIPNQNDLTKNIKVIADKARTNIIDCIKYSIKPKNWSKN